MTRDERWRSESVLAHIDPVAVLRVFEPAQGEKVVRFVGPGGNAVEVAISDQRAADFLDIAQYVFQGIHADLADRRAADAQPALDSVAEAGWLGAPERVADLDIYPCEDCEEDDDGG